MLYYKKLVVVILMFAAHIAYTSQKNTHDLVIFDRPQFDEIKFAKQAHVQLADQLAYYKNLEKKREGSVLYDAKLDNMAPELIGKILGYISDQVGTQGFVNKADIPVILKNVHRVGSVNKKLQEGVHSVIATNTLIESLAVRFQMTPLDVAVLIKTKGAQAWLRKYIHKSGDYELFKDVQQIFSISREVCEQVKPYGVDIESGQRGWPGVNSCYGQTKQGLMLTIDSFPDELCTPWGKAKLFGHGSCRGGVGFAIVSQEFLKRMTANFEGISDGSYTTDNPKYYEQQKEIILDSASQQSFKDCFKEISKEEVVTKKGQQVLITSSICGVRSVYKINAIGDKQLSPAEWMPRQDYKSYAAAGAIWKLMDNEFHGRPAEFEKKWTSSYTYEKPARIYPESYQVVPEVYAATMQDVAAQYIQLAAQVTNQPEFTGEGSMGKNVKVLPCADSDDARIVEELTNNANKLLPQENQWHFNGQCLGNGLELYAYKDVNPCSLGVLEDKYRQSISKLQAGWQQAKLIDNQDILHTQSEEEWLLFLKKKELIQEDRFLRILASKFKANKKMSCHADWKNKNQDINNQHDNEMYLWIRKDAIDEVRNVLGLELTLRKDKA